MADEIFDLFGWTTSYTVNSNSGAILKYNIGYNYKTKILLIATSFASRLNYRRSKYLAGLNSWKDIWCMQFAYGIQKRLASIMS